MRMSHRYFVVVPTLSVLIQHAKKKDLLHIYTDYLVNISVSLQISGCFIVTTILCVSFLLGVSFFHHFSSLSLPPHSLNLLPQSVVLKGAALKRETTSLLNKPRKELYLQRPVVGLLFFGLLFFFYRGREVKSFLKV